MKKRRYGLAALLLALAVIVGCAPQPAPAPPPAPAPQAAPVVPAQASPTISPAEAAWERVVAAAKREGVVTIYSSAFVGDVGGQLSQEFKKKYGIRVEILGQSGSSSLEKIKVEAAIKHQIGDVMQSSIGSVAILVKQGLAERIAEELPSIQDKNAFLFDPVFSPGGDSVTYAVSFMGALVNSKLVKPEDYPTSLYDFLNPKWKGQLLVLEPRRVGGGTPLFYTLRYYKVLDMDFYRRLAEQKPTISAGAGREEYKSIARGEFAAIPIASDLTVAPIMAEGAPLKLLPLKEGTLVGGEIISLVKGAPHPNAGKLFINWLLSPEGQVAYHQTSASTPFRKGLPDFLLPQARIEHTKLFPRTWEAEEWSQKDAAAGTMKQIFGDK